MEVETNSQPREPSSSNENMVAAPTEDSRTHSNPTLEEVIAKQHASRHNPPLILPRPSNKDYSSPDAHSHSRPAARKSSRSVVESKPKEHQNKCPPPGTRAAKLRTIEASLARCTSPDKAQALLAKKGFTLQGWAEHKAMIAATKPKSKGRGKSMGTGKLRSVTSNTVSTASSANRAVTSIEREFLSELWGPGGQQWIEDEYLWPQLVLRAKQINQYHCGPGTPHLFCIIARFENVEEMYDVSQPLDYLCCSAIKHPNLNGSEALRLTASILSGIQHNAGAVRCDLQSGYKRWKEIRMWPHFTILETILKSCSLAISIAEPQFASLQFRTIDFSGPNFVIDVTDPLEPKYCYLHCEDGNYRTLCYAPKDLGFDFHHATVLRSPETYNYTHALASYRVIRSHSIQSAWPHLIHPQDIPPFAFFPNIGNFEKMVLAYDHPWPISYPPELDGGLGFRDAGIDQAISDIIQHARKGFPLEPEQLYLPFAPFIGAEILSRLLEFYSNLQGLTFAGNDIFKSVEACEILNNNVHGLVYLNLLSCDIPEEGLNYIRNMPSLDTFIHESTFFPGLIGCIPPEVQGTRRSLKINLTVISDIPGSLLSDELTETVAEFNYYRDRSILSRLGFQVYEIAAQHPFMGPLSAAHCLKELVGVLSDSRCSRHWADSPSLLNGIFCKGYRPDVQAGLPVTMSPEPWEDYEDDDGTRLMVTHWAGDTYVCFSEWTTDFHGQRMLEKYTADVYLGRYMNYFVRGDITKKCDELRTWFGDGWKVRGAQDFMHSPHADSGRGQATMEGMELRSGHEFDEGYEGMAFERTSSSEESGEDGDTEIEDI